MNHQAKKKFGQNFLRDKNLLKKIVESANIKQKNVIEIGPGQGALTGFLSEQASSVIAYEIDTSLKPILDVLENKYENLSIVYEDFMRVDFSHLIGKTYHIVANVPYYITSPILFKFLETPCFESATMMIQKEVCDRLLAKAKTKAYNALSIIVEAHTIAKKITDVKRHMFTPVPNVDSAVIQMIKREQPLLNEKGIQLVKAAFQQKRKTLVNNWHQALNISKIQLENILIQSNIDKNVRAEDVSLQAFLQLQTRLELQHIEIKSI